LRIYSGILSDGNSRPVGKDAIRLVLFTKNSEGKILRICGDKRVNRVENWRNNLHERITNWQTFFPKENCCKCGSVLVVRKNKTTKFLGCSEYPKCKFTKSLI
jgi:hypothetical protein